MKRRVRQLLALSLHEWRLMTTALVLLPGVAILLHMIGYKRTKSLMHRFIPTHQNGVSSCELEAESAHLIAHVICGVAAHGPYRANCLKRSLVLWWMLARRGMHSEIRFGVPKLPEDAFGAHAWVECNGEALCGPLELHQQLSGVG